MIESSVLVSFQIFFLNGLHAIDLLLWMGISDRVTVSPNLISDEYFLPVRRLFLHQELVTFALHIKRENT